MASSTTPGALFVLMEPQRDDAEFQKWRQHAFDDQIPGLRNKYGLSATDEITPSTPYRYLSVYEVDDISKIDEELVKRLQQDAQEALSRSEWQIYERFRYDVRDGLGATPPGTVVISHGQTPKDDPATVDEFHRWYNEQHIGHIREIPGWRTGSRYKFLHRSGDQAEYAAPIAVVHQYDENNGIGGPEFNESVNNPWTKRIRSLMSVPNHRRVWKVDF
ncbi:MAG: hypothetical protein M4579_005640 [Chaenotheca gracillima]|nr:MAG: hypothetical protein M4579_005640 [Chaenotheca gracillima]